MFSLLIVAIFIYFSSFFLLFSALFIFFCFLLYFLIVFAFSFRKIINFLLVPLVFKFENTFFVFLFSFLLYLFYFVSTYNKILIVAIFNYYEGRTIRH